MSQDIFNDINPAVTSGTQLANDILNPFKDAVASGFSGTSRPANLQAGGYWVDTTNDPTTWDFNIYDGTSDITVFTLDLASGIATFSSGGSQLTLQRSTVDTVAPALKFLKERGSGGQTLDGDELAEVQIVGTDSGGNERVHAYLKFTSDDNTAAGALGSIFTIEMANAGTGSVAEIFRVVDGKFGFQNNNPQNTIHAEGDGIRHTRNTDDTSSSKIILEKKRTTGDQVLSGDNIGEVDMQSTDDVATAFTAASIRSSANENHTSTARGTTLTISNTDVGDTSESAAITINDSVTVNKPLIALNGLEVQGTLTYVNTTNMDVTDANITINKGGTEATADAQTAGITIEMSDATDVVLGFDSSLASKMKLGESGSESEVITQSAQQILANKDFDGGTASNTSRLTLPQADTATLAALTRKEGTIFYDTTTNRVRYDDGSTILDVGAVAANLSIRTESSNYTAVATDDVILVDASSGNVTITLPTAVGNSGKVFYIKKIDTSINTVIVDGDGTETVEGELTQVIGLQDDFLTLFSDNSNFRIIGAYRGVIAKYSTNAGQSIPNSTATTVIFEDLGYDSHGAMNTSTGEYTVPYKGKYRVTSTLTFGSSTTWSGTEVLRMDVRVFGISTDSPINTYPNNSSGGAIAAGIAGSVDVECDAGDVIEVRVDQRSGASLSLLTSNANNFVVIQKVA